jgi:hypothetical protein
MTGSGDTTSVGGPGSANTGGGGGGGGSFVGLGLPGGNGGSGIIILRYPNTRNIIIGSGLTGTTANVGSDKVTTITQGTGTVIWS